MRLRDFSVLSFDCYGTLIDWESGLLTALRPLVARAAVGLSDGAVLEAFAARECRQQAMTPAMPYAELLAVVHATLAQDWGVAPDAAENARFGASIGNWPAFPDTVAALRALQQHCRLVILSNVDRASFQATSARLGVTFDAIYTAQDIGSYKPDRRNFDFLLARQAELGVGRDRILHVAQSLFHDHGPANAVGLASAWIDRRQDIGGWGATVPPHDGVRWDFRFGSLGDLAAAYQADVAAG